MVAMEEKRVVAILGCGIMGSGIAQVCLTSGYTVRMYGRRAETHEEVRAAIKKRLSRKAEKKTGVITDLEELVSLQMQELTLCDRIEDTVRQAFIIIEAVTEDRTLKINLFEEVQKFCRRDALMVTNTSSIRLHDLFDAFADPSRFAGLHFFSPVPLMKLVEVITTEHNTPQTTTALLNFCTSLGKKPVQCKDTPGFIVNRLLVPFLVDAVRMLERGDATKEHIDTAIQAGVSHPMGPLELCDFVGLDTLRNVLAEWHESMPEDSRFKPCALLDELVSQGRLGRKTNSGFYEYK